MILDQENKIKDGKISLSNNPPRITVCSCILVLLFMSSTINCDHMVHLMFGRLNHSNTHCCRIVWMATLNFIVCPFVTWSIIKHWKCWQSWRSHSVPLSKIVQVVYAVKWSQDVSEKKKKNHSPTSYGTEYHLGKRLVQREGDYGWW